MLEHGVRLLPSSGFSRLADVRHYLLQYHTESWLDTEMDDWFPFTESDGNLYVMIARFGTVRTDWTTATHELIEQDGSHAVVETTVLSGNWEMGAHNPNFVPIQSTYLFTFIDGRIDHVNRDIRHFDWYVD